MNLRHKHFGALTLTVTILFLAGGCGQKASDKIYDTSGNPENLPEQALTLLNDIESGELDNFENISNSFGELYVVQPDLLDSKPWQMIVNNLGVKFRLIADSLVKQGVEYYTQAGGLYTLASFAQPDDQYVKAQATLFSVWRFGVKDPSLAVYNEFKGKDNLRFQLGRVRHFMEGDSLQARFAEKYLIKQALVPLIEEKADEISQLDQSDKDFLKSIKLLK